MHNQQIYVCGVIQLGKQMSSYQLEELGVYICKLNN